VEPELRGELYKYQEEEGGERVSQAQTPTQQEFAKYHETTNLRFLCFIKGMRTDATSEESEKFRVLFLDLLKKNNVKLILYGNAVGVVEDYVYVFEAPDVRTYQRVLAGLMAFRPTRIDYYRTVTVS